MTPSDTPSQMVLDYHERTKHHLHRFARSAGHMDWENQPNPFRTYDGAKPLPLQLTTTDPSLDYTALYHPTAADPAPFDRAAIGTLLELSLGLSAWKAVPGQRWSLRINPSSGNLHPTEAHLITIGIKDLSDGIYHYHPLNHALEERALILPRHARDLRPHLATPSLLVTLSSIFWRESWKYGERAFRYCQHDIGHALAALSLAARLLGWRLVRLEATDHAIAAAFGFDRTPWPPQEAEEPALIATVCPTSDTPPPAVFPAEAAEILRAIPLTGRPNQLSPRHRDWDIIPRTTAACRQNYHSALAPPLEMIPLAYPPGPEAKTASAIIRQRRSAQAFDPDGRLDRKAFIGLLDRTRPRPACPPFDAAIGPTRISLALFVHRVQGVPPGLYAFIRHPAHLESLREATSASFIWEPFTPDFPLYLLKSGDFRAEAIDLSCRQEIGGFSTFSLGMLAQFEPEISDTPWVYRHLFWEAGMIGQVLYLEAEARGARGTGIGCYFDDAVHEQLGLANRRWQSLYHFTIGFPVEDSRLQTLPPYFHLGPERKRRPG
jgi:SagB-type dehydrogenase family enzyme